MSKIKVIFPEDFDKQQLEALAQVFDMHIVYDSPNEYELVPRSNECNVISMRNARIEAVKKRMAERELNKPEPRPMTLSNASPIPVKHKKSFLSKWFQSNPIIDGPGAA
tara:strand:+ start:33651 stop:33977 length:327 start_codon:yes stop_codon:yes gene_type:complete